MVLGQGAMGVVYRAWDDNLERPVAVKVMASELRAHPEAMTLFRHEAKALAQLNHPNIVGVYDQTTVGGETYMIMELVEGRTLEAILAQRRRLAVATSVRVIDQLLAGLAYAHGRKVIHRDIKPANVSVSKDNVVKLGDFGLARITRELSTRQTQIRGTPLYMAPEQITGTNIDHRADLYAVGCTLFELVCGRTPFVDGDILYHLLHTPPPAPSSVLPGLPEALDAIVLRMIAKSADDRFGDAESVRAALRPLA